MKQENDEIKPQNILMKISWAQSIKMLNNKEKAIVLINIFNYHTGEQLLPMSKTSQLFFANAEEVFDYNIEQYKKKVAANRKNGLSGGRPKLENITNISERSNNPINPDGFPENPKNLKEKDIVKAIDIEKERVKENCIDTATDIGTEINIENIPTEEKIMLDKFKKVLELNIDEILDPEDKVFYLEVNALVNEVGWKIFYQLILGTKFTAVADLIYANNITAYSDSIFDIRRHHNYFLSKLAQ